MIWSQGAPSRGDVGKGALHQETNRFCYALDEAVQLSRLQDSVFFYGDRFYQLGTKNVAARPSAREQRGVVASGLPDA